VLVIVNVVVSPVVEVDSANPPTCASAGFTETIPQTPAPCPDEYGCFGSLHPPLSRAELNADRKPLFAPKQWQCDCSEAREVKRAGVGAPT